MQEITCSKILLINVEIKRNRESILNALIVIKVNISKKIRSYM